MIPHHSPPRALPSRAHPLRHQSHPRNRNEGLVLRLPVLLPALKAKHSMSPTMARHTTIKNLMNLNKLKLCCRMVRKRTLLCGAVPIIMTRKRRRCRDEGVRWRETPPSMRSNKQGIGPSLYVHRWVSYYIYEEYIVMSYYTPRQQSWGEVYSTLIQYKNAFLPV